MQDMWNQTPTFGAATVLAFAAIMLLLNTVYVFLTLACAGSVTAALKFWWVVIFAGTFLAVLPVISAYYGTSLTDPMTFWIVLAGVFLWNLAWALVSKAFDNS